jgi:hypothetical protein
LKELAPLLRRDFPASWQRFLDAARAKPHPDYADELNAMANGPVLSIDQIIGPIETKSTTTNQED